MEKGVNKTNRHWFGIEGKNNAGDFGDSLFEK